MLCPSCNKFASLEAEVEENTALELDGTQLSGEYRVVRRSSCCGDEMKEALFNFDEDLSGALADHEGDEHVLTLEAEEPELLEEGGGRYKKAFFGVTVNYSIRCSCQKEGDEPVTAGTLEDKVQASGMDELA